MRARALTFFEVVYTFAMMGNPQNIKLIYAYTIEKIFENLEYDENIFYVLIA